MPADADRSATPPTPGGETDSSQQQQRLRGERRRSRPRPGSRARELRRAEKASERSQDQEDNEQEEEATPVAQTGQGREEDTASGDAELSEDQVLTAPETTDTEMLDSPMLATGSYPAAAAQNGEELGPEADASAAVSGASVPDEQEGRASPEEDDDDELDQLDSTPAGTPKAANRAVTRARQSDSHASGSGINDTPETSEDDEAEVRLSLLTHAAPASPGRRSPAGKSSRALSAEAEEAPLPPSAQTPAKTAAEQAEDEEHLAQAANTRLPSSSPEPDLPTIGGAKKYGRDDSSSDDSSDDSDSDDDDSSSGDDAGGAGAGGGGFLTGAARRLQAATGGRQSLGMVARDAFGKSRRSSLASKKSSTFGVSGAGYNPSPLKNSAVATGTTASSSSPNKGEPAAADDLDEIDQLMSQTQQSQRAVRRTSGVDWARLEQEEEERQRRKSGKATEASSEGEEAEEEFAEAQEQLEAAPVDAQAETVPADDDVDMALAEDETDVSAAANGAPAAAGEPVTGAESAAAPRDTVAGDSAPITTALRNVDTDAVEPVEAARPSQPLPANGVAALEAPAPTQEASQFPNGARLYPDLSTIGDLASSSQPGSPPFEVDPSQVASEDEQEGGQPAEVEQQDDAAAKELPAESQFVPLQKDKPLFLETQSQLETQNEASMEGDEPDTQDGEDTVMQDQAPSNDEAKAGEALQVRI